MREVPELTFRGALSVLGQYDRPVLERLNTLLGGVVMVGGAVALTGVGALPLVGLAAVWGWVDQKNEALELIRKLLDKVGDHRAAVRGYDRTRLVAAAHTIIVANSVVNSFRVAMGEKAFKELAITEKELTTLLAQSGDGGRKSTEVLYDSAVPMPSAGRGYEETLNDVLQWQRRFAAALVEFCGGLRAGQAVRHVEPHKVAVQAQRQYQNQYRRLAAQVPEFHVWAMLNEHAATRGIIANAHKDIKVAMSDHVHAMSRLESLLTAMYGRTVDQVFALHRAVRAGLDEPVVPRDGSAMSFLADIRIPLVREIFTQPNYRCERVDARSRVADEQWWRLLPIREDLDVRLVAHLASAEATRLPLLVLGHPGAGKSLLMKVLAARLPTDQYTTVYVPLRYVSGTASVYQQVEQALAKETNGRVDWVGLVHQSQTTTRVILLDGLDEMLQAADRDRASYLHDVAEFQWREATQDRPVVMLVTSRTLVADRVDVPIGTTVVKLEEFSPKQVNRWREVWNTVNHDVIDAGTVRELTHEAVARQHALACQPLLLLMLALYSADRSFPAIESGLSRTALYRMLFDNFTRREATKVPDVTSPQEQLQQLSVAALGMFNRGRQYITDAELAADLMALVSGRDKRVAPDQQLVAQFFFVYTAEADLDTDRARRSYEFLHATFGEYLVAREIVDTLVDAADSAGGRRGIREPDDDRLFALLSYDCLAVRDPILDFVADLLAEQQPVELERVSAVIVSLLASARRRQGSSRYSDYRPLGTNHVRAIAAYTANLVLLGILIQPPQQGVNVDALIGDAAPWRPTLDLWRSGLAADSWYALLAAIERDSDTLYLSSERTRSTGLDAELRHALLARDFELVYTVQMGRSIRGSVRSTRRVSDASETQVSSETEEETSSREELLGWVVAMLASGNEPDEQPMHHERMNELLDAIGEDDRFMPMVAMVLKQRARQLSPEIVQELVTYLLDQDSRDVYAFIAAAGAHPRLLTEFPQLMEADRYVGMQGSTFMIEGTMTVNPKSRVKLVHLLNLINKQRAGTPSANQDHSVVVAAFLDAFQWRLDS
jgi:hypothetical protein